MLSEVSQSQKSKRSDSTCMKELGWPDSQSEKGQQLPGARGSEGSAIV